MRPAYETTERSLDIKNMLTWAMPGRTQTTIFGNSLHGHWHRTGLHTVQQLQGYVVIFDEQDQQSVETSAQEPTDE